MRPWFQRALPMLIVPVALVAAVALFGSGRPPSGPGLAGQQPAQSARLPVVDAIGATSARVALAQEDAAPTGEEPAEAADDPAMEDAAPEVVDAPPAEVPEIVAPAPTSTPGPAAATTPQGTPLPVAGEPTPTVDFAALMNEPAVQTAIATMISQFSGMAPALPLPASGSGQPQGAPPAAQTQAAIMMATLTTPQ